MLTKLKQNDHQIIPFTVVRKHFFLNRTYKLKIENNVLLMSHEDNFAKPKYKLQLSYKTQFEWIIRNGQLIGFLFPYQDRIKEFYGDEQNLLILKKVLGKIIIYKSVSVHYQFISTIDTGTFGQVSLFKSFLSNEQVAMKILTNSEKISQHSIDNEIAILSKLNHSNVLKLLEVFVTNFTYSIVTEFIDGKNLKQLVKENVEFSEELALNIMRQLFEGLDYIHNQNILHRDIKPANIIFGKNGKVKIIDFGLACFDGQQFKETPKCGTPGYCAPEILLYSEKTLNYDFKVDVFSAGCTLYKILTSKGLFDADTSFQVLKKNKNCLFSIKEQGRLFDLIRILIKQNPLDRPSSKQALDLITLMIDDKYFDVNIWYKQLFSLNQSTSTISISQTPKVSYNLKTPHKSLSTPNSSRSFFPNSIKTQR